ncbi:hypothetical protein [Arthrobacter sp. efr-133-TYG-118]|uniref:hypothetical protein n=1 Tax=Arthrobacter sp. efr-133-TYG-118 TaxID=3040279 RepID=UPI00254FD55B|nr:hypothetical protein [Arthrobacter sp. efr-133-TYG-118]
MRAIPIIALGAVALFSILARNFVGKFLYAVVHEIPAVNMQERGFLKAMSIFSVGFGVVLFCMSILMASNVIFPW